MSNFVPHDQLTPGLWYIKQSFPPYYTVVSLTEMAFGPTKGQLGVWSIDREGCDDIFIFDDYQFIGPVPSPFEPKEKK